MNLKTIELIALMINLLFSITVFGREENEQAQVSIEKRTREKSASIETMASQRGRVPAKDIYADGLEKKLIKGIDTSIAYLKKTVAGMPKKSQSRFSMLEKIVNLSLEQASYVSSQEQSDYDNNWEQWDLNGRKGAEPKISTQKSDRYWGDLYITAKEIKAEFPKAKGVERIIFNGGLSLQFLGKDDEASKEFRYIIAKYPKADLLPEVFYALGEYYFAKNDFKKALVEFLKAAKFHDNKLYGWMLFKIGWCYFNLGKFQVALDQWKKTVRITSKSDEKKLLKVKDETLRDMVFAFAELHQIDKAILYYKQNSAEENIPSLLKLLAETYFDQGRFNDAIVAWEKYLNLFPNGESAGYAQLQIAQIYFEKNDYAKLWKAEEKLLRVYGETSHWAKKLPAEQRRDILEKIRTATLYYPKMIHKQGQKAKAKKLNDAAKHGYKIFISFYPKSIELAETKEYLADIEYFEGNYSDAGKLYLEITSLGERAAIFDDKGKIKENIHKRSAKNMLDAYNKALEPDLKKLLAHKPDFKKSSVPLGINSKNFIKACGLYTKWYPKDGETAKKCDLFISEIYYRNGDKDKAKKALWLVAQKYANTKDGLKAVESLVPMLEDDPNELHNMSGKLLAMKEYSTGDLGKKLRDLLQNLEVDRITKEKSTVKRAKLYKAQALRFPKNSDADKFWFNAANEFIKAQLPLEAYSAYEKLVALYPASSLAKDSFLQLAKMSELLLDYPKAFIYYNQYAKIEKDQSKFDSVQNIMCRLKLFIDAPDGDQFCLANARGNSQRSSHIIQMIISKHASEKQWGHLNQFAQRLEQMGFSGGSVIEAYYPIYHNSKNRGEKQAIASRIKAIYARGQGIAGNALRYVSEVEYNMVKNDVDKFTQLKLRGSNIQTLQNSIQLLNSGVLNLEKKYNSVFSTQDSYYAVEAFSDLGYCYEYFANQLANPPSVKGAKDSDVKEQLQASVQNVLAKANSYYKMALDTASKFTTYNEGRVRANNGMNRITYLVREQLEWVIDPDFIGNDIDYRVLKNL